MKKGFILSLFTIAVVFTIGMMILYRKFQRPLGMTIDKIQYPIYGIDFSKHTGYIDFQRLSRQEIDFIFIKATEGDKYIDPSFEKNYLGSKSSGIPVGAYHFFRFKKSGAKQAANFLTAIHGKNLQLPLVLDIEEWGNSGIYLRDNVIKEISAFLLHIKMHTKMKIIIYTNESSYKKFISKNFDDKEIWICSFKVSPKLKKWTFWQYSHKGRIAGAKEYVDLNTFNGNRSEWNTYLKKSIDSNNSNN